MRYLSGVKNENVLPSSLLAWPRYLSKCGGGCVNCFLRLVLVNSIDLFRSGISGGFGTISNQLETL